MRRERGHIEIENFVGRHRRYCFPSGFLSVQKCRLGVEIWIAEGRSDCGGRKHAELTRQGQHCASRIRDRKSIVLGDFVVENLASNLLDSFTSELRHLILLKSPRTHARYLHLSTLEKGFGKPRSRQIATSARLPDR